MMSCVETNYPQKKGKTPFPDMGLEVLYAIIALGKVNMFYNL
jgi:hypothetical protein